MSTTKESEIKGKKKKLLKSVKSLLLPEENVKITKSFSSGSFGKVKKGYVRIGNFKVSVAIKIFEDISSDEKEIDFLHEVHLLKLCQHQNIIKILGYYISVETHSDDDDDSDNDSDNSNPTEYKTGHIVLEFCELGDVTGFIKKLNKKSKCLPLDVKYELLIQLCTGIKYLHESKIIHRDLKPQNVLVKKNGSVYEIKVCDFGVSKTIGSIGSTYCGTDVFICPELFKKQLKSVSEATRFLLKKKQDIYSFGIIAYIMLTQKLNPYDHVESDNHMALVFKIHREKIRPHISRLRKLNIAEDVIEFIQKLWDENPLKRPDDFSEIISAFKKFRKRLNNKSKEVVTEPLSKKDEKIKKKEKETPVEIIKQKSFPLKMNNPNKRSGRSSTTKIETLKKEKKISKTRIHKSISTPSFQYYSKYNNTNTRPPPFGIKKIQNANDFIIPRRPQKPDSQPSTSDDFDVEKKKKKKNILVSPTEDIRDELLRGFSQYLNMKKVKILGKYFLKEAVVFQKRVKINFVNETITSMIEQPLITLSKSLPVNKIQKGEGLLSLTNVNVPAILTPTKTNKKKEYGVVQFSITNKIIRKNEDVYFEVKLVESKMLQPIVGIGLAPKKYDVGMVGWEKKSIGFHSDDGGVYCGEGSSNDHLQRFTVGDVIGIGKSSEAIFFTKNGKIFSRSFSVHIPNYFVPTITIKHSNTKLQVIVEESKLLYREFNPINKKYRILNDLMREKKIVCNGVNVDLENDVIIAPYKAKIRDLSNNFRAVFQFAFNSFIVRNKNIHYFEIKVLRSQSQTPVIGIGFAPKNYTDGMTGWFKDSIGYHSDDGKVFHNNGYISPKNGKVMISVPKETLIEYGIGDTIGCGWKVEKDDRSSRIGSFIFFTKNGKVHKRIFKKSFEDAKKNNFFPTLTMRYSGIRVQLISNPQELLFDGFDNLNPKSSSLFSKEGETFLDLKEINEDTLGYKLRHLE